MVYRRAPSRRATAAFTLVEILVVVVILGVISAVLIPQLTSRADLVASAAARQVMSDLTYAQNQAITTQRRVFVQFTPVSAGGGVTGRGTYSVLTQLPATVMVHPITRSPWTVNFGGGRGAWATVAIDAASFDGRTLLMFDEAGAPHTIASPSSPPEPLSDGWVRVTCGGITLTIRVEPLTGTLTVE
ncbi:MAG: prepilin-type N-terminal cleavage/methylation domain-containing protein [Tepidisphaerales bacterium]